MGKLEKPDKLGKKEIYEDIKQKIIDERLAPGYWLVEKDLCDIYNISRTPIRELLWQLLADGFVEQETNKGFVVRRISLEQVFEIFQTREAIECMATSLACQKWNENFKKELEYIKEELSKEGIEEDVQKCMILGRSLHRAILNVANNGMMSSIYAQLENLSILTNNLARMISLEERSRVAHIELIDALLSCDVEKSEMIMRNHMRDTCRLIVEQFYPGMFDGNS